MNNWKDSYQKWNDFAELDANLKTEMVSMSTEQKEDAFYTNLEFGTAGMRGILGAGTNRMNIYTIRKATAGFAQYICTQGADAKQRGVAIAYDSRHMSKEFSEVAASTLASYGVKAYVFEQLRPTPELSFAVRHLNAYGGIVITASHNPKNYNGFKIYDETGCQCVPEVAAQVVDLVNKVTDELTMVVQPSQVYQDQGLIEYLGATLDDAYNDAVIKTSFADVPRDDVKMVYTSLHGTGFFPVKKAFDTLGYKHVYYVEEQCQPDADFTTVPLPNPEDPKVFDLATQLAHKVDADVLLATDPDADRLGIAVKKSDGSYELLNGNTTGGLMTYYILDRLKAQGKLPGNGILFTTIVSSDFAEKVATSFGITTERTLTGFKFIGDRIQHYEQTGEYTFLFGFEESYGSLTNAEIARDKDAVQAVVILAEMVAFYKAQGKTLLDVLAELEKLYGCFREGLVNISLTGIEGQAKIKQLIDHVSNHPFTAMNGSEVVMHENYLSRKRYTKAGEEQLTLPKSDVLKFFLADGSWFCVRPSGTEPKAKVYIAVNEATVDAAHTKITELETAIMDEINKILA